MHTLSVQLPFNVNLNMARKKSKDGEEMAEIAGKMWNFLDKLHTESPAEYKKFIDEQMEEGKKMLTPPEPVYCLHCQVRAWVSCASSFRSAVVVSCCLTMLPLSGKMVNY